MFKFWLQHIAMSTVENLAMLQSFWFLKSERWCFYSALASKVHETVKYKRSDCHRESSEKAFIIIVTGAIFLVIFMPVHAIIITSFSRNNHHILQLQPWSVTFQTSVCQQELKSISADVLIHLLNSQLIIFFRNSNGN